MTTPPSNIPLSTFQRNRHAWPSPESSIGPFCGTTPDNFNYWEAQGPARDVFNRLRTEINQVLEEECDPVPSSSAIVYDVYMVGRSPDTAAPRIMVSSKYVESRKQAVNAIKKSGILDRDGVAGVQIRHWEGPPHIINF